MEKVIINKDEYEDLLKYRDLYQNEKNHSETLQAIVDRLLDHIDDSAKVTQPEDDYDGGIVVIGLIDEDDDDFEIKGTREQKRDIDNAMSDISKTLYEYFMD